MFSSWQAWAASSLNQGCEPLATKTHAFLAAASLLQLTVLCNNSCWEFEWSFLAARILRSITLSSYTGKIRRGRGMSRRIIWSWQSREGSHTYRQMIVEIGECGECGERENNRSTLEVPENSADIKYRQGPLDPI